MPTEYWQYAASQEVPRHQEAESHLGAGVLLCQNKSQRAASITAAKAVYSQAALDAKTKFWMTVMEAKTIRCHSIQAAEAACSNAINEAEAQTISQATMLQEEHSRYMQNLEEQAFKEESRSCHEVLSSCQTTLYHSPQSFRGLLASSFHLLLGQAPPSPTLILPPRVPSAEEQPSTTAPSAPTPKQSPRPKRWLPLPEPTGNMPLGGATLAATLGDLPTPKSERTLPSLSCWSPAMLRPSSETWI